MELSGRQAAIRKFQAGTLTHRVVQWAPGLLGYPQTCAFSQVGQQKGTKGTLAQPGPTGRWRQWLCCVPGAQWKRLGDPVSWIPSKQQRTHLLR